MPMDKARMIEQLKADPLVLEPGQDVELARLRPEDAPGVARLFFAVYGPEYPAEIPYVPDLLIRANEDGQMYSAVARTPKGDIVGHVALYRSSPPNPRLYELGQGVVHPAYRGGSLMLHLQELLIHKLGPTLPIDSVFGEGVAHRVTMQRMLQPLGFAETGIEVDLMPEGSFAREGEPGRVSAVLVSWTYLDLPQVLHVPACYRGQLEFILADAGIARTLQESNSSPAEGSVSDFRTEAFQGAGVLRGNLASIGADVEEMVRAFEARAEGEGFPVRQVFLSLHQPWADQAVEALRARGYFFSGLVPRWFGQDALILQKLTGEPGYARIKPFTDKVRRLLDFIQSDREQVLGQPGKTGLGS